MKKVLVELRSALRGDDFDKDLFIDKMKVIDEMIIDQIRCLINLPKSMIKNLNKKIKNFKI